MASEGMQKVDWLLHAGDRSQAIAVFAGVHEPMHATASRLAPVDREGAEVVDDITEVLDRNLRNPNAQSTTLTELSHKAIQLLDQARSVVG